MSTPSSRCGSSAGFLIAVTRILWPSTTIESPSTVTSLGNRPCTESKRRRWALVSTGPRSFTATTWMSLRPLSTMARRMLRPIRPNPLIATFTAIVFTPCAARLFAGASQIMGSQDPLRHRLRRDAEVAVEIPVGRACPEAAHADEDPVRADKRVPAEAHRRLDGNLHGRIANDAGADLFRLSQEEIERGHRDNPN